MKISVTYNNEFDSFIVSDSTCQLVKTYRGQDLKTKECYHDACMRKFLREQLPHKTIHDVDLVNINKNTISYKIKGM